MKVELGKKCRQMKWERLQRGGEPAVFKCGTDGSAADAGGPDQLADFEHGRKQKGAPSPPKMPVWGDRKNRLDM